MHSIGTPFADPVAFEVIRHRLQGITTEQAARIMTISGSKQVTEMSDFNVGLYLADGSVAVMGHASLHHSACMAHMVRSVIEDCTDDPGIGEGDMFIVNDPWKGAMHAPDMALLAPLHIDGQLVMWSGGMMHMSDIGGMAEGSLVQAATEMYQEGLHLTPVRLIEGGHLRNDIFKMILSNCRHPATMGLDLKGLIASNNAAREGLENLVRRYGVDMLQYVMKRLIDISEERLRLRIAELPEAIVTGVGLLEYDAAIDDIPQVHVELRKVGDGLRFDFSKSSDQLPSAVNCTRGGLHAAVAVALLPTLAYGIPWNGGLFRALDIVCPEGKICNAKRPAAVSGNIAGAMWEASTASLIALSRLLACSDTFLEEAQASACGRPRALAFFGANQYGERYRGRTSDVIASGGGAYADHDGVSTQGNHGQERARISNVESLELDYPILYLRRAWATDNGGAGRQRGGLSLLGVYALHGAEATFQYLNQEWRSPDAIGLFGGYPGGETGHDLIRHSDLLEQFRNGHIPDFHELSGERVPEAQRPAMMRLDGSDVVRANPAAGAGWGDPLDRAPADVQADVRARAISSAAAESVFGCVLDAAGTVDGAATKRKRAALFTLRRSWPANLTLTSAPAGALTRVSPVGDRMEIVNDAAGVYWTRCRCGAVLARAGDNWREYAGKHVADPQLPGIGLKVHELLELREYACRSCGRLHAVDVCRKADPEPNDIRFVLNRKVLP